MKLLFCVFAMFLSEFAFSQVEIYKPMATKPADEKIFVQKLKDDLDGQADKLTDKYKKELKEYYQQVYKMRVSDLEEGNLIFDDKFLGYMNTILDEILKSNTGLITQRKYTLYLEKNVEPNAFTMIDGSITFNTGLLMYCQNESQLAFIICHELAHSELKHIKESLRRQLDFNNSKATKAKEKEIIKSEYGGRQKAIDYLTKVLYNKRKHSRENEVEADSLGVRLFMNTKYDTRAALEVMDLLDSLNEIVFTSKFDLKYMFNFKEYPFKSKWVEEEQTMFKSGQTVIDDSLSRDSMITHPDCKLRKGKLHTCCVAKYIPTDAKKYHLQDEKLFSLYRKSAMYETLYAMFEHNDISLCLFTALNLIKENPNDITLNYMVSSCLNLLFDAQKEHTFSKKVDFPTRKMEKDYRVFLEFLHKLKLSEIGNIAYYMAKSRAASFSQNEFFLHCLIIASKNNEQADDLAKYKAKYLELFPKGTYATEIKSF
jgi:Peptidase family M48